MFQTVTNIFCTVYEIYTSATIYNENKIISKHILWYNWQVLNAQREEWRLTLREGLNCDLEVLKRRVRGKFTPDILPYLELLSIETLTELLLEVG